MKHKLLSFLLGGAILTSVAFAQEKKINGRVTGDNGKGLPGVTVLVQGTNQATQTDSNGNYSISVPAGKTLVFRSVGFSDKTIIVNQNSSLYNVSLEGSSSELDEVIVTGYGTQRKREITGSITSIKGETIKDVPVPSLDKALQGQAAGVQVSTTSGLLGQAAKIRIRGTNSISSSSTPLYVIDGVPYLSGDNGAIMANNPLADINPNDIASLEVLKDGAATAIYGSRAANGVILITTKKGKTGSPVMTYDGWVAAASPSKYFDLLNAKEFIEITNEKLKNSNNPEAAFETKDPVSGEVYDTDWQKEIFRTGLQHNHALSFSGATERTNYYFSGGFTDMQGISDANSLRKFSLRAKAEQKVFNDKVTIGFNSAVSNQTNYGFNTSEAGLSSNVAAAILAFPNVPAKWADGSYNLSSDLKSLGQGSNTLPIYGNYTNQRYVLDKNIYKSNMLSFNGNGFINIEILKGLSFRSQIGVTAQNGEDFLYWDPGHGDGQSVNGRIYQYSLPRNLYNWQNLLNYTTEWTDHSLSVLVGSEYQKSKTRYFYAHGFGLSSTYFAENENIISGSLTNQLLGGAASERSFSSIFGKVNYAFKERYLLSASLRHDKLSDLPFGEQGAILPGVSLGWDVAKESFFNSNLISQFKIRGGYAKVGNTEIGLYPYAGLFSATQYGAENGIYFSQAGNNKLKFETSYKWNFGVDLAFLQDRFFFTADYFANDINNMILAVPTAPSLGIPDNVISQNVGTMSNKGVEASLSGTIIKKENFSWNTNLNATYVTNTVKTLAGRPIPYNYHRVEVGHALGSFYGYEYVGVNAANGNALYTKADGSIVQNLGGSTSYAFYNEADPTDVSNTKDAALGESDKKWMGQGNPKWFGGFNNTFTYKGFDLSLNFSFAAGYKIYNKTRQELLSNTNFANAGKELLDRWTAPGQQTDVPKLYYGVDNALNLNSSLNSRFLENGAYLRAQRIGLGYNFSNAPFLKSIYLSKLRVFATVDNAFVLTGYKGLDPDLANSSTSNAQPAIDFRSNPIPRTFTFGVNASF
ncbi:TonB-dependent receptor [Sphingobacterium sp. N143]|uniref:SusC/RagA family TonB-linked outer membrane protein n=1 Tax=Sphingobacterium sp. N143 TaxID=2746727 RepID=UPI002576B4DE|nr:TonB-dependent receptor [Sphingobacterium sp. N143]MDM1294475.1 TonB-dependent receptor [Sphingobacterium sp. N143]